MLSRRRSISPDLSPSFPFSARGEGEAEGRGEVRMTTSGDCFGHCVPSQ